IFLLLSSRRSHHDLPLLSLTAKSWATSYSKLTEANTAGPLTIGLARSQTAPVNKRANRPPAARSSAWARSANHSDRVTKHRQCTERTGDGRHARTARRPTLVRWWERDWASMLVDGLSGSALVRGMGAARTQGASTSLRPSFAWTTG